MTTVFIMAAATLLLQCKEKTRNDIIITQKVEKPQPQGPVAMQDYRQNTQVQWQNADYVCDVHRTACDSVKTVTNEEGQLFIDNRITLTVTRADGTVFFKKEFVKGNFSSLLDNNFRNNGILEGLVFDRVDGERLRFAASVCLPQTDEYLPIVIFVNRQGGISMEVATEEE
ncbi:MAG: DUF4738 domain-containing protein [Prevotella sp.]